jgi:hypothetical protein
VLRPRCPRIAAAAQLKLDQLLFDSDFRDHYGIAFAQRDSIVPQAITDFPKVHRKLVVRPHIHAAVVARHVHLENHMRAFESTFENNRILRKADRNQ